MDNGSVIRPGDIQYMSAGRGVTHSEFNHSASEPVHLLQIWILAGELDTAPRYDQKKFSLINRKNKLQLVVSATGEENSVRILQNVKMYASILEENCQLTYPIENGRHAWLQLIRGNLLLNQQTMNAWDGCAVTDEVKLDIKAKTESEFLLFDLS